MFKMNTSNWTVFPRPFHSSADQSKGLLFPLLDFPNLIPIDQGFWQKIQTLRWHMEQELAFRFDFFAFLFIPLHSSWMFCFLSGTSKLASMNTSIEILYKKPSLSISNLGSQPSCIKKSSKWTLLTGLFSHVLFIPPLTKVRGSCFLCWISKIWFL